jgi:hypothetical protein
VPLSPALTEHSNSPEAMLGALVSQQVSAQAVPKDLWLFGTLRGAKKILNHEDTKDTKI